MLRFLLLLSLLLAIALLFRWFKSAKLANKNKQPNKKPATAMVKCDHCGIYLPKPEALQKQNHYFCHHHTDPK